MQRKFYSPSGGLAVTDLASRMSVAISARTTLTLSKLPLVAAATSNTGSDETSPLNRHGAIDAASKKHRIFCKREVEGRGYEYFIIHGRTLESTTRTSPLQSLPAPCHRSFVGSAIWRPVCSASAIVIAAVWNWRVVEGYQYYRHECIGRESILPSQKVLLIASVTNGFLYEKNRLSGNTFPL